MKRTFIYLAISIILLSSCDKKKAQEKDADLRLKRIETLIADNSYNAAKIAIDSIHELYPRLVNKRRIAGALEDTIERRESARTLAYCQNILPQKTREADSIQRNFRFEKNAKYQQYGDYIYKTQITESNLSRNYLKAYVNENADLYLVSNYCGSNIEQSSLEVAVNDLYAHTDTLSTRSAGYHSFNDGGMHWETLTFKNEADKGVCSFIAQNISARIKVTLYGKKTYIYYLADADKKAIAETYKLWIAKKDVKQLNNEIKKAQYKIDRISLQKI